MRRGIFLFVGLTVLGSQVAVAGAKDWHDVQWVIAEGCHKVSIGCQHCSAEELLARNQSAATHDARWTGDVELFPERLDNPLRWTRPMIVFVCPVSDFFHRDIPDDFRLRAWQIMEASAGHTFVIVTKRSGDMRQWCLMHPPPSNVWIMVSVETEGQFIRIYDLLDIKARVRAVSCEPLLRRVDLSNFLGPRKINWVVAGPEIGSRARPCDADWMREIRDDCIGAGVPFFTKHLLDGKAHREFPRHC